MNLIERIAERLAQGRTVSKTNDNSNLTFTTKYDEGILQKSLLESVKQEFSQELKEIEVTAKEREEFEIEKNRFKSKMEQEKESFEMDKKLELKKIEAQKNEDKVMTESLKRTLEASIRMETDDDKKEVMKTGLENVSLKERIVYLTSELDFYRKQADRANEGLAETLKTAFTGKRKAKTLKLSKAN